jgi:hypothetical protein
LKLSGNRVKQVAMAMSTLPANSVYLEKGTLQLTISIG